MLEDFEAPERQGSPERLICLDPKRLKILNIRQSPVIVPRDRTMTKEMYKTMDSIFRKAYQENRPRMYEAMSDAIKYGLGMYFNQQL